MNPRKWDPPGIYAKHIARYLGVRVQTVENICNRLGIERWSLGTMGRKGPLVPLSIEQVMRILGQFRADEGEKLYRRHRVRRAS